MKKLTCSAIALTMTCAAGFASDGEWSALDQEVGALASTLNLQGGAAISGSVNTSYTDFSDADVGGFTVNDARLAVDGAHGAYSYHVDVDFADNDDGDSEGLRGAYAKWGMTDSVTAQMGQFRASATNDGDLDENEMKHTAHSAVGGAFTAFTSGLGLSGSASQISWALSIMNGTDDVINVGDGLGDELLTVIRVGMDLMDGGDDGIDVSANIAISDNGANDDDGATVIEVNAGNGTWSLGVETMDTDEGFTNALAGSDQGGAAGLVADASAMVISGSYNIDANWEVAVRMTDYDDDATGSELTEITANNYLDGHGLKWQIGMVQVDTDAGDTDWMTIGLTVSF